MFRALSRLAFGLALTLGLTTMALAQAPAAASSGPEATDGDFVIPNFRFHTGETLPALRMHYTTVGTPIRDGRGRVTNAVLIMHGTGGWGRSLIRKEFSGVLFSPGGLLDARRYFIILPDDIGGGKSSKPSDGLRMHFPHYDYDDMVAAEYRLVTDGLHVNHLRLVMGVSMGCMHSFLWGETYPDFMDALMPMACLPDPIAGRNRAWRKMLLDAITSDPAWMAGDYKEEPMQGLRAAADIILIVGSAPLVMQKAMPTVAEADAYVAREVPREIASLDANDTLYQFDSSRDYDASQSLEAIKVPVMWINSADDFINPPELGIAERDVKRIKHGRFVLIPIGPETRGHRTHTMAAVWKDYLAELLKKTER